jgi:outer membrane lipoprotein carrier protein
MKIIISLLTVLFFTTSFSQDAESVLKSLQKKFDSINDLTVEVTQKSDSKSALTGKMFFKKQNNIKIEFPSQTIVTDGKTSWNYNKKTNKVIISNYDDSGSDFLSINYLVYQFPTECNLSLSEENGMKVLVLNPKSKQNNFATIKLFTTKDYLISKATIISQTGGLVEVSFSNYKLNPKLADSLFSFTPPKGTSVIDLR